MKFACLSFSTPPRRTSLDFKTLSSSRVDLRSDPMPKSELEEIRDRYMFVCGAYHATRIVTPTKRPSSEYRFGSQSLEIETHFCKLEMSSGIDSISLSAKSNTVRAVICNSDSGNILNSFPGSRKIFRDGNPDRAINPISCNLFCPASSSSTILVD